MLTKLWAAVATLAAAALFVLHFANPYPLIQVPEKGHRLFFVQTSQHDIMVNAFQKIGLQPFGTFNAGGVRQTLFEDGMTVVGSSTEMELPHAGLSIPTDDPIVKADLFVAEMQRFGISAVAKALPVAGGSTIVAVALPGFGWGIAFRKPGRKMPKPQWEE